MFYDRQKYCIVHPLDHKEHTRPNEDKQNHYRETHKQHDYDPVRPKDLSVPPVDFSCNPERNCKVLTIEQQVIAGREEFQQNFSLSICSAIAVCVECPHSNYYQGNHQFVHTQAQQ